MREASQVIFISTSSAHRSEAGGGDPRILGMHTQQ